MADTSIIRERADRRHHIQSPNEIRKPLAGQDKEVLATALSEIGIEGKQLRMRVAQLWRWIYVRGARSFDEMTDISKNLRTQLKRKFSLDRPQIISEQTSKDGTRKWLLRFTRNRTDLNAPEIECVYIPETDRGTLCISSQVGCTLNCSFCYTGTQSFVRNLTTQEIVAQILVARDRIGDWPDKKVEVDGGLLPQSERKVTNVVFMGMGEPLYNFENVKNAVSIASDNEGISLSRRRITLSTSGVVPEIERWGSTANTMLAISLHATRDDLRNKLVPINRRWPIADLMKTCRAYPSLSNARKITFEYVMIKDVNDSIPEAHALIKLLAGIPAKVNIIPFNPWPGCAYQCSDLRQIKRFIEVINKSGYACPIRTPRGRDIFAACGQLKSESERLRKSLCVIEAEN